MQNGKFLSGRTAPGEGWQNYPDRNGDGVYLDVDTSEAGSPTRPRISPPSPATTACG